jgi:hypothetical protein
MLVLVRRVDVETFFVSAAKVSAISFMGLKLRKRKLITFCKLKLQQGKFSLGIIFCTGLECCRICDGIYRNIIQK